MSDTWRVEGTATNTQGERRRFVGELLVESDEPLGTAVQDGLWSSPTTWSRRQLPLPGTVVTIPRNITVVFDLEHYSTDALRRIVVSGALGFAHQRDTHLYVGTLEILPLGWLIINHVSPGDPPHVTTVTFVDYWDDLEQDDRMVGLLAAGTIVLRGRPKTCFAEINAITQNVLDLNSAPVGWQAGDGMVIPPSGGPSMYYTARPLEYATVHSSEDNRIRLTEPLTGTHDGWYRDGDPIVLRPDVLNLTRSIVFRSLDPTHRGHCMFYGPCTPDISYVSFENLGRTTMAEGSIPGRYAVHFHMLGWNVGDTGPRFRLEGCVVTNVGKWGVVVHGSHLGEILDNTVVGAEHAGFVTEDGSESNSVFQGNHACDIKNGHGYWINGVNNAFEDNKASACFGDPQGFVNQFGMELGGYGFWIVRNTGRAREEHTVPTADGGTETFVIGERGCRRFVGNECYSVRGGVYFDHRLGKHVVKDQTVWSSYGNVDYGIAVAAYDTGDQGSLTVEGLVSRGASVDVYSNRLTTVRGCDVRGSTIGLRDRSDAGLLVVANSAFQNEVDVWLTLSLTSKAAEPLPPGWWIKSALLNNNRLLGQTPLHLAAGRDGQDSRIPVVDNWVRVESWQGVPGDDFRVYWAEQEASVIVPYEGDIQDVPGITKKASPEPGLSNQACWEKFGFAWAGSVMPIEAVAREGVAGGLVVPTGEEALGREHL